MSSDESGSTDGILNTTRNTIHRPRRPGTTKSTACGHTYHFEKDTLRVTDIDRALAIDGIDRCGRCFEDTQ